MSHHVMISKGEIFTTAGHGPSYRVHGGSTRMTADLPPVGLTSLPPAETIDDVLRNIDVVLDWSIAVGSKIGYFAALYKRVTLAIREAIIAGVFDDGARMERMDVEFARRYFDALNAYFQPDGNRGPTLPWEVAFVGGKHDRATMLQHMLAGLNAHITFDLAPATLLAAPGQPLSPLEADFNRVNALLCSQIPGMLDKVETVSPAVIWMRRLVPSEIFILQHMLTKLRRSAWLSAVFAAMNPDRVTEQVVNQAAWTAAIGAWYLDPPASAFGVFPRLVKSVARRERPDVAANIEVLLTGAQTPAAMDERYLPKRGQPTAGSSIFRARNSSGSSAPAGKA
ncbi:hypothetical protein CIW51_03055 [Mycolicibacterium sp. P9-22]|nr:hypothetical protein CIW51_03055 [Mycolicibacterium sp. P9-22]